MIRKLLGMCSLLKKCGAAAVDEASAVILEIIMRRYGRASTLLTSNCPVDDWARCSTT